MGLSAEAINLWQLEPEVALVLGADLPPRADGQPHSVEAVRLDNCRKSEYLQKCPEHIKKTSVVLQTIEAKKE